MSKELPYFQFEPAQYLSGDILLCSYEAQGVFVHLMSIYWQRDCELTLFKAQRLIDSKSWDELLDEDIITLEGHNDDIIISFLDRQFEQLTKRKKRLSDAGKKGAEIKKNKATLKSPLSDEQPTFKQPEEIREEEKRKEEIIKEDIKPASPSVSKFNFRLSMTLKEFNPILIDDWLKVRKTKKASNTKTALNAFLNEIKKSGRDKNEVLKMCVENSWAGFKSEWLKNPSFTKPQSPHMNLIKDADYSEEM